MKTEPILAQMCPNAKNIPAFALALDTYMPKFQINTKERIAMFLTQAIHESGHFTAFSENLNYSADRLAAVWPSRYAERNVNGNIIKGKPNKVAKSLHRNPEKIANNVYANRMGNGPEASGDGWKFRGRGIFQFTGTYNYTLFAKSQPEIPVLANPDLLTNAPEAVISACWFWSNSKLNEYADKGDIVGCSKAINGGLIGIEDRKKIYSKILALLS